MKVRVLCRKRSSRLIASAEDVYDEDTAIRDVMAREVRNLSSRGIALKYLQTERLQENAAKLAAGQDLNDDEDILSDEDIEEELGYISPLDSVDPYLAFKRSLSSTRVSCVVVLTLMPHR